MLFGKFDFCDEIPELRVMKTFIRTADYVIMHLKNNKLAFASLYFEQYDDHV